jgi:hypothetical protein
MKRLLSFIVAWAFIFCWGSSEAEIPKLINYQGMLTDDSGGTLTDTVDIVFVVYDDPGPIGGNIKWAETQYDVSVINGLFNVILGSANPIDLAFDQDYWLDVTVEGEHMPERLKFTSVGYAYRALVADSAVVAESTPTGGGWTDDGSVVRLNDSDDKVGIGTSSPTYQLEVIRSPFSADVFRVGSDSSWLEVKTGGNTRVGLGDGHGNEAGIIYTTETDQGENVIGIAGCEDLGSCYSFLVCNQNGGVGIGTSSPATLLDIRGLPGFPAVARANQIGDISWAGWRVDRDSTEKWFVGIGNTNDNLLFRREASSNDVVIDTLGNVGIGTSEPDRKLHIVGAGPRILIESSSGNPEVNFKGAGDSGADVWALYKETISGDLRFYQNSNKVTIQNGTGNVGIGTTSPGSYKLAINGDAAKPGGGTWDNFSDARLKNVGPAYESGLAEVVKLKPFRYRYRSGNKLNLPSTREFVGLIAQDVEKVLPDAVSRNDQGYLMLNSDPILWAMLNSIKELKTENEELRRRIETLERK